jgi:hypothetical protein
MVNENILAAVFLLDEAEALCVVEPLYSALNHSNQILFVVVKTAWQVLRGCVQRGYRKEVTEGV